MQEKVYKIKYLPRFEKDLEQITDYITFELYSTDSAINLVNKIEKAILQRQYCPLSFEPFQSTLKSSYRHRKSLRQISIHLRLLTFHCII